MIGSATIRKFGVAAIASVAVHAVALSALAWTVLPMIEQRLLVVESAPFAGKQIAIAMSFARPDVQVPPPPEAPSFESPVLITPAEAQLDRHVYVDKQAAEVDALATTTTPKLEVAELTLPEQPVAERETQTSPAERSSVTTPHGALAKQQRQITPSTASVAVPPQTLGTHDRRPARLHNNRPPRYPDIARQNRWEGTVLLKLTIDAQGRVTTVQVVTSSGFPVLDAEAATAVRIWRGEPATRDGVAIESEEYLPVRFKL